VKFHESPYIRWIKNRHPEPDPQYIYELNCLRAMVRQEDRQGTLVGEGLGRRNATNV
jgi:hypothetical protein